ncbi:DUF2092 domain-containing protein [Lysobacter cavernae]|uniref:DUF2092 domain-containing protein n=1 Tax=Lysobacter cavernae TaxID=1685901 RepID=A0ABV7RLU1_9GAMM
MSRIALFLALNAALFAPAALAQTKTAPPAAASAAPTVDPRATAALEKMGAHLRSLKHFGLHADTAIDLVMEDGQKLEFPGTVDYKVRAPNGLQVDVKSDRKERQMFFDGKTLTVYAPKMKYYASVDAPGTIHDLLSTAQDDFGIELPLADLFLWGTPQASKSAIQSAVFVGPARVDGSVTEHYAFRQQDVDWQVWIEVGDKPLPRRLVITTTDDPALPQYAATLDWNTNATFKDSSFTFAPSKDAQRIQLAEVDVVVVEDKEGTP